MSTSERDTEEALARLGAPDAAPPMGDALRAAIDRLEPARTRRPRREWALFVSAGLAYAVLLAVGVRLRPDLGALPPLWVAGFTLLWVASFVAVAWLVFSPPPGGILPRWRAAAATAWIAAALLVASGLLFVAHVPGQSTTYELTLQALIGYGRPCLQLGLGAAVVPALFATIALRRGAVVGARWFASAVGAAAGSLGGLVLHLHCPISERIHVGLIHGGVVVLTAVLCALGVSRLLRP